VSGRATPFGGAVHGGGLAARVVLVVFVVIAAACDAGLHHYPLVTYILYAMQPLPAREI